MVIFLTWIVPHMHGTLHLYICDVTRDWNHNFARCGDVTNARDKKQTVLCALSYFRLFAWRLYCCEMRSMRAFAWFNCLLRPSKSILQLCRLSEHVDIAFIIKMGMTPQRLVCTWKQLERIWLSAVHAGGCEYDIHCSLFLHNMLL